MAQRAECMVGHTGPPWERGAEEEERERGKRRKMEDKAEEIILARVAPSTKASMQGPHKGLPIESGM